MNWACECLNKWISGREGIKSHPFFACLDWNAVLHKQVNVPFIPHVDGPLDYKYFDRMIPGVRDEGWSWEIVNDCGVGLFSAESSVWDGVAASDSARAGTPGDGESAESQANSNAEYWIGHSIYWIWIFMRLMSMMCLFERVGMGGSVLWMRVEKKGNWNGFNVRGVEWMIANIQGFIVL